jgi:hypothetical protein
MTGTWTYKGFQIHEGLKPGAKKFQYFFVISRAGGQKECRCCVWIPDEALLLFDPRGDFASIVASHAEQWRDWVRKKLDAGDLKDKALRLTPEAREIELSEIAEKIGVEP